MRIFCLQQVDDRYIRTIHLHSSGGSGGGSSTGKNSHRAKTLTNGQQYRERHEPSGPRDRHDSSSTSRVRTLMSHLAQTSGRGELIFFFALFLFFFEAGTLLISIF